MSRQLANVSNSDSSPNRILRFILLSAIALCLGMIVINAFRYRPLLGMRAFTIADSFEAVVKVLVIGPVVGAIFGGIGGLIARQCLTRG